MINKLTAGHNLRWESSRIILPEHAAAVLEWQSSLNKLNKPAIDEQQWQEFSLIISEAQVNNQKLKITIWKEGFFYDTIGWLNNVNMQLKKIRLDVDEFDVEYIDFEDITDVGIID